MNLPKKRIRRAEFHGIILNFVECGIAHGVQSPYFCLKAEFKLNFNWISAFLDLKLFFLGSNTDFPFFKQFNIPQKSKNIEWNSARGIRFLGTSLYIYEICFLKNYSFFKSCWI